MRAARIATMTLALSLALAPIPALAEELSARDDGVAQEIETTLSQDESPSEPTSDESVDQSADEHTDESAATPSEVAQEVLPVSDGAKDCAGEPAEETQETTVSPTLTGDECSVDASEPIVAEDVAAGAATEEAETTDEADALDEQQLATAETVVAAGDTAVFTLKPAANDELRVAVTSNGATSSVALAKDSSTLGEYWRVVGNEDGTYSLANLLDGGWLSYSGTAKAGTKVTTGSSAATCWLLEDRGDGTCSFAPLGYAGLRLALSGDATAGTTLQLANLSASSWAQRFLFDVHQALTEALTSGTALDAGVVTIESDYRSGKVVEVGRCSTANSANVAVYTYNAGRNQKLVLTPVGSNLYTLQASHSGKLLEVRGGSTASGANVTQYARNGKLHQLWYFVADGSGYSIRNAKSGLALQALSAASGSNVQVETVADSVSGKTAQRFFVKVANLLEDASVYRIAPAYATSLLVSLEGNASAKGTNVQLGSAGYLLGQYWRVKASTDGSFSLVSCRSGYALASKGAAKHRADVQVSDNATGTLWVATVNDDGTLTLRPKSDTTIALDIPRASSASGANVWLYQAGSEVSKAQRFVITLEKPLTAAVQAGQAVASDVYAILLTSTPGKGVNIRGNSKANSGQVVIYTAGSALNEKFQLSYAGGGLYTIQAANSGKYVELKGGGTTAGTKVQQYASNAKLHQYWYLVKDGSGYSIRSAKSGLAIAVEGGKTTNSTPLVLAAATSSASQRFTLKQVPLVADGSYGIATSLCNPLVLDVSGASTKSGGNVIVYIANGKKNQQFTFKRQSDGTYTILNVNSNRYLEVKNASTSDGANIQQGTTSSSSAQRWKIEVSAQGGLAFKNVSTGKYLEFKGGTIRLSTNVQQTSKGTSSSASFVIVKAGYNPVVGKIGWQCASGYPQVSRYTVSLPSYAQNTSYSYVTPSSIRVDATREECIEAFIARAYDYLNAGSYYREPWAQAPGGGIDCSGLVLQCLYATGMDLEHAAGSEKVGGYNPYNHATVAAQTYNSARWYENKTFKPVSTSVMQRGDLVYYGYYSDGAPVITHVAIYLGNNQIIHSTDYSGSGNKVRTDSVYIWNPIGAQRPFA